MGATYNPAARSIIENEFRQAGLNDYAIAAWMSRFNAESAFDPNAFRANDAAPGKNSYGIGQWNQDRWTALKNFASKQGTSWNDPKTQAQFALSEIKDGGSHSFVGKKFDQATSLQDAVDAAIMYENPKGASHKVNGETVWTPRNAMAYNKTLTDAEKYYGKTDTDPLTQMKQISDPKAYNAWHAAQSKSIDDVQKTVDTPTNDGIANPDNIANLLATAFKPNDTTSTAPKAPAAPSLSQLSSLFAPRIQWQGLS